MIGLTNEQTSLVQAAIEVRDSGLSNGSRSKLFNSMGLTSTQQAKLGLAIDLKDGELNMEDLEDTQYLNSLNMTKDQIEAFSEVLSISNGDYDAPLNESELATKFGIDVSDVQVLAEARILEETLDISKLEGTKLAEIMGISEKQIKQLVSIQKADFNGMRDSGVFAQIGFGREQEAIEGLFRAMAKDDLQSSLLESVSAVYAAHSLYSDKMASIQDLKTTNPLAALINAGLTENNSGLTQAQINAVSLMIDLATGNKKANQIGIDDYRTILEQQGLGDA
jgi:hypothetical protein